MNIRPDVDLCCGTSRARKNSHNKCVSETKGNNNPLCCQQPRAESTPKAMRLCGCQGGQGDTGYSPGDEQSLSAIGTTVSLPPGAMEITPILHDKGASQRQINEALGLTSELDLRTGQGSELLLKPIVPVSAGLRYVEAPKSLVNVEMQPNSAMQSSETINTRRTSVRNVNSVPAPEIAPESESNGGESPEGTSSTLTMSDVRTLDSDVDFIDFFFRQSDALAAEASFMGTAAQGNVAQFCSVRPSRATFQAARPANLDLSETQANDVTFDRPQPDTDIERRIEGATFSERRADNVTLNMPVGPSEGNPFSEPYLKNATFSKPLQDIAKFSHCALIPDSATFAVSHPDNARLPGSRAGKATFTGSRAFGGLHAEEATIHKLRKMNKQEFFKPVQPSSDAKLSIGAPHRQASLLNTTFEMSEAAIRTKTRASKKSLKIAVKKSYRDILDDSRHVEAAASRPFGYEKQQDRLRIDDWCDTHFVSVNSPDGDRDVSTSCARVGAASHDVLLNTRLSTQSPAFVQSEKPMHHDSGFNYPIYENVFRKPDAKSVRNQAKNFWRITSTIDLDVSDVVPKEFPLINDASHVGSSFNNSVWSAEQVHCPGQYGLGLPWTIAQQHFVTGAKGETTGQNRFVHDAARIPSGRRDRKLYSGRQRGIDAQPCTVIGSEHSKRKIKSQGLAINNSGTEHWLGGVHHCDYATSRKCQHSITAAEKHFEDADFAVCRNCVHKEHRENVGCDSLGGFVGFHCKDVRSTKIRHRLADKHCDKDSGNISNSKKDRYHHSDHVRYLNSLAGVENISEGNYVNVNERLVMVEDRVAPRLGVRPPCIGQERSPVMSSIDLPPVQANASQSDRCDVTSADLEELVPPMHKSKQRRRGVQLVALSSKKSDGIPPVKLMQISTVSNETANMSTNVNFSEKTGDRNNFKTRADILNRRSFTTSSAGQARAYGPPIENYDMTQSTVTGRKRAPSGPCKENESIKRPSSGAICGGCDVCSQHHMSRHRDVLCLRSAEVLRPVQECDSRHGSERHRVVPKCRNIEHSDICGHFGADISNADGRAMCSFSECQDKYGTNSYDFVESAIASSSSKRCCSIDQRDAAFLAASTCEASTGDITASVMSDVNLHASFRCPRTIFSSPRHCQNVSPSVTVSSRFTSRHPPSPVERSLSDLTFTSDATTFMRRPLAPRHPITARRGEELREPRRRLFSRSLRIVSRYLKQRAKLGLTAGRGEAGEIGEATGIGSAKGLGRAVGVHGKRKVRNTKMTTLAVI